MENVNDIHRVVRSELSSTLPVGGRVCFSYLTPEDAGPADLGDLFEQDLDFLMVEVNIDLVKRAGPGVVSPRRVWGHLELTFHSKAVRDLDILATQLEAVANHFRETTLQGVRFREFTPSGDTRDRGFSAATGVIPFDFETRAKHDN